MRNINKNQIKILALNIISEKFKQWTQQNGGQIIKGLEDKLIKKKFHQNTSLQKKRLKNRNTASVAYQALLGVYLYILGVQEREWREIGTEIIKGLGGRQRLEVTA